MVKEKEEKYEGWLTSPNFLKRSAAIWGHYFVFNLLIWIVVFIVFAILWFSLFSIFMNSDSMKEYINSWEFHQMVEQELGNSNLDIKINTD